jgi:hypothetical protein
MSEPLTWAIMNIPDDRDPSEVLAHLQQAGIAAELVLRIPHPQADAAHNALLAMADLANPSHDLDLETITRVPELEAASIRGLLESNGIQVFVEEAVAFPSLPMEINVPRRDAELARQIIADARRAGESALETESEL